jgi:MOSC domain-containing protein YiiM
MTYRLLAVSVAQPRVIGERLSEPVLSSIEKKTVSGRIAVGPMGVAGDSQADLTVHGGADKAVYAYDEGDYHFWEQRLGRKLPPGTFGENLTVEGLPSDLVRVGDRYRIGTTLLEVTQPRLPCYKLGMRMNDPHFVAAFAKALRVGFYLRVIEPGALAAGDTISVEYRAATVFSIADLMELYLSGRHDIEHLSAVVEMPGLSAAWREELSERLTKARDASA